MLVSLCLPGWFIEKSGKHIDFPFIMGVFMSNTSVCSPTLTSRYEHNSLLFSEHSGCGCVQAVRTHSVSLSNGNLRKHDKLFYGN